MSGCLSDPQKQPTCATVYVLFVPKELLLLCGAEMDQSAIEQLAALLLLISPFFFWGTSMVAFKVCTLPALASLLTLKDFWEFTT